MTSLLSLSLLVYSFLLRSFLSFAAPGPTSAAGETATLALSPPPPLFAQRPCSAGGMCHLEAARKSARGTASRTSVSGKLSVNSQVTSAWTFVDNSGRPPSSSICNTGNHTLCATRTSCCPWELRRFASTGTTITLIGFAGLAFSRVGLPAVHPDSLPSPRPNTAPCPVRGTCRSRASNGRSRRFLRASGFQRAPLIDESKSAGKLRARFRGRHMCICQNASASTLRSSSSPHGCKAGSRPVRWKRLPRR